MECVLKRLKLRFERSWREVKWRNSVSEGFNCARVEECFRLTRRALLYWFRSGMPPTLFLRRFQEKITEKSNFHENMKVIRRTNGIRLNMKSICKWNRLCSLRERLLPINVAIFHLINYEFHFISLSIVVDQSPWAEKGKTLRANRDCAHILEEIYLIFSSRGAQLNHSISGLACRVR